MFEPLIDRARWVVVQAQEEARMLNDTYIGTEHILLSLISEGDGTAVLVLVSLGAEPNRVRQQISQLISGQQPHLGRWAPPWKAEAAAEVQAPLLGAPLPGLRPGKVRLGLTLTAPVDPTALATGVAAVRRGSGRANAVDRSAPVASMASCAG